MVEKTVKAEMLNIIVCMKIIIDPEAPFSDFKIDRENQKPIPPSGTPPVFSPFDENALESALKIKDQRECKVTILSLGRTLPRVILQKALAVGADEAIAIEGPEFENLDPFSTAQILANAIKKIGEYDLIFTGRQGADWDAGLVWAGIAELLGLPSITIARRAEIHDRKLIVERCVSDGLEVLESELPVVVTFTSEAGELRSVALPALIKAKRQKIPKWSASEMGFQKVNVVEIRDLYEPDLGNIDHYLVPGKSPEEKGHNLAKRLVEEGVL
ncbi:MAG: electron transfer flavoprotein subunit beta/FixA family protein [Thermodesulfobacteriota bacterium]